MKILVLMKLPKNLKLSKESPKVVFWAIVTIFEISVKTGESDNERWFN